MFEVIRVSNMAFYSLLSIRIQYLDNNFAHLFQELVLVFPLAHITAGVGRGLGGLGTGGHAGLRG